MKALYLALASGLALSACGGPPPTDAIFTDVQRDGTTITGQYNSAGFSAAEARSIISNVCTDGALATYGEQPTESITLVQFTCANGNPYGANAGVNFKRTGTNTASYSAIFSDGNGNLMSAQGNVSF